MLLWLQRPSEHQIQMDAEYRNARTLRRKLEKIWKHTRREEDHLKFVAQQDICAQMVTSKREAYYAVMITLESRIRGGGPLINFWKNVHPPHFYSNPPIY